MSQKLKKAIVLTASYYGKKLSDEVLNMYAYDLKDHDEEMCLQILNAWRLENKVFPLPLEIINKINELKKDPLLDAGLIAARITGAVRKFGYANPADARKFIGEHGWYLVQQKGGWTFICENLGMNLNITTFEAQNRNQLESLVKSYSVDEITLLAGPKSKQDLLEGAGSILNKLGLTTPS